MKINKLLIFLIFASCGQWECPPDTGVAGFPLPTGVFKHVTESVYFANIKSVEVTESQVIIRIIANDQRVWRLVYDIDLSFRSLW